MLPAHSAAELAGYVLETGEQASVVQFLQQMIEEGKVVIPSTKQNSQKVLSSYLKKRH